MSVSSVQQPANPSLLGKKQSTQIKGVAIIMLVLHHLFLFPSTNPWFTSIWGNHWGNVEFFLSAVSKLCIPLFFFIGGYGLWQASCHDTHIWKSTFRRIGNLYTIYATTIIVTVLLFFCMNGSWILLSKRHTLETFLGIDVTINGSWWFFIIYIELLLLTPLATLWVKKLSWWSLLLFSFLVYLLSPASGFFFFSSRLEQFAFSSLMYDFFPLNLFWFNQLFFFTGFCFAASGLFNRAIGKSINTFPNSSLRSGIALIFIGLTLLFRHNFIEIGTFLGMLSQERIDIFQYVAISARADFILGPLLVFAFTLLFHQYQLSILTLLGKHSAAIWLIHSSIIAITMVLLKQVRPWSPLIFVFVLFICILYALAYSTSYRWIKNRIAGY